MKYALVAFGLLALAIHERRIEDAPAEFVIGSWSAPRNLDQDYFDFLVSLGFNHTLYWRSPEVNPTKWKKDLDRAAAQNLKLVFDSWQPAAVPEKWLLAVLETACSHPAFAGVYLPDEPGYRYPLEDFSRRPSPERFSWAKDQFNRCGKGVLFHVDSITAREEWIRLFLPFSTAFGIDVYPFKRGLDWKGRVRTASEKAVLLAEEKPVWMVLQGHGRGDWYQYAVEQLNLTLPSEDDERPDAAVLLEMAKIAHGTGVQGVWWWSFELYDWAKAEHRAFILQFKQVNEELKKYRPLE
ncbi:MAG: hypothetical protein HY645_13005 [Acidobacteria bacterium]|nr:hypothetical protein [Acidobacteriota bacterium]